MKAKAQDGHATTITCVTPHCITLLFWQHPYIDTAELLIFPKKGESDLHFSPPPPDISINSVPMRAPSNVRYTSTWYGDTPITACCYDSIHPYPCALAYLLCSYLSTWPQ